MKFIIFDIDGTLTNTKAVDDECFIKSFQSVFEIDISNENWSQLKNVTDWGITEEIIQRERNRIVTHDELSLMEKTHVGLLKQAKQSSSNKFEIVKDADRFLRHVDNHPNYKIGIATGAWKQSALLKLQPFGLDMNKIAFSHSNRFKSRATITQDVITQLTDQHGKSEEVIYLGDGAWDYKTCQILGIKFIGIDCNEDGTLKALSVENIFKNYSDVESITAKM